MQTNFSTITIAGRPHPNMQRHAEMAATRVPSNAGFNDQSSFGASVNKTLGITFQKLNKAGAVVADILEPVGKCLIVSIGRKFSTVPTFQERFRPK